jgi:hypothetical protein
MFEYEHSSRFNVSKEMRSQLVSEIEGDEFHLSPIQGKIMLNDLETLLTEMQGKDLEEIEHEFILKAGKEYKTFMKDMFSDIKEFIKTEPLLPNESKNYISLEYPEISIDDTRDEIVKKVHALADKSELCLLTLYTYREMDTLDWLPFIKAAIERNPVCFNELNGKRTDEVYDILRDMPDESIYDGTRLSLPDEVWNFGRGDGIEKAFLLADYLMLKDGIKDVRIDIDDKSVVLEYDSHKYDFRSLKGLRKGITIGTNGYHIRQVT